MIEILYAIIASLIYALTGYIKSHTNEDFDPIKFFATIIIGAFVGVVLSIAHTPITEATVAEQMGVYMALTVIIENILKAIKRKFF